MGKRKSRLNDDASPEVRTICWIYSVNPFGCDLTLVAGQAQVDYLINESTKNLDKGNFGSAEFKAMEALNTAKNALGFEHPMVSSPD